MADENNAARVDESTPPQAAPENSKGNGGEAAATPDATTDQAAQLGGDDGWNAALQMAGGDPNKVAELKGPAVPSQNAPQRTSPTSELHSDKAGEESAKAPADQVKTEEVKEEVDEKDLTMPQRWSLAGGTIVGRDHVGMGGTLTGVNNQDAMFAMMADDYFLGIVCDGCSEGTNSEVGAKFLARIVAKAVLKYRKDGTFRSVLPKIQEEIISEMRSYAEGLAIEGTVWSVPKVAEQFFLATILGLYISENESVFFGIGDGAYGYDDRIKVLKPFGENDPAYIGYHLYDEWPEHIGTRDLRIYDSLPSYKTPEVVWIGTDGFGELRDFQGRKFPGTQESIPSIRRLLEDSALYEPTNAGMLNGKLRSLQQESMRIDAVSKQEPIPGGGQRFIVEVREVRASGLLMDDATVIALKRKRKAAKVPETTFGTFGLGQQSAAVTPKLDPVGVGGGSSLGSDKKPPTEVDLWQRPSRLGDLPLGSGRERSLEPLRTDAKGPKTRIAPQGEDLKKSPEAATPKVGIFARIILFFTWPFRAIAKRWREWREDVAEVEETFREVEEQERSDRFRKKPRR